MNIEALRELREQISSADVLERYYYFHPVEDGQSCYCAVGHVFKLGGATDEEMSKKLETDNGASINKIRNRNQTVEKWIEQSGITDIKFLERLQHINDGETTNRKEKVLEFIDLSINDLQIKALENLKESILNAGKLVDTIYIDKDESTGKACYCAIGHIFKLGGASDEEIEALGADNCSSIEYLVDIGGHEQVIEWVENSGITDLIFLFTLQDANDLSNGENRMEKVISVIDHEINSLKNKATL